jgi:methylphosphotriester-DNA--protein-cysteine methyltransferase
MSQRSVQRHFRRVTGMTFSSYQQIQRARHAAALLSSGSSVLNATFDAGYFDQAHPHPLGQAIDRDDAGPARAREAAIVVLIQNNDRLTGYSSLAPAQWRE